MDQVSLGACLVAVNGLLAFRNVPKQDFPCLLADGHGFAGPKRVVCFEDIQPGSAVRGTLAAIHFIFRPTIQFHY